MAINFLRNTERTRWFNQSGGDGCTDATAINYDANATVDDGSCIAAIPGCMDTTASNYDALANQDDGSCIAGVPGCMDATASNYNDQANVDDGSCIVVTTFNLGDIVGMNVCPTVTPPAVAVCATGRGQIEEVTTDALGNETYKVFWVEGDQAGLSSTLAGDNLLAAQLQVGDRVKKSTGIPCDPLILQTNPAACPQGSYELEGTYQGMSSTTAPYSYQLLWDDGTTTQPVPSMFKLVSAATTTSIVTPTTPTTPPIVPPTMQPPPPVLAPVVCKDKEYSIAGNCIDKTLVLVVLAIGAYMYVNKKKS